MSQQFKVVQNLLSRGQTRARLNNTWRDIHEETGLGVIAQAHISFTSNELNTLRESIKRDTGLDPQHAGSQAPTSRLEAAELTTDEKAAIGTVFGAEIRVARVGNAPIQTTEGDATIPPGMALAIHIERLITQDETLVIIENGEAMSEWHRFKFPPELDGALLIYRGHGRDAKAVKQLLARRDYAQSIGFYDFDPAGLLLALSYRHSAIIVPNLERDLGLIRAHTKATAFWGQRELLARLEQKHPSALKPILSGMKAYGIALMQEHIAAHGISLNLLSLQSTFTPLTLDQHCAWLKQQNYSRRALKSAEDSFGNPVICQCESESVIRSAREPARFKAEFLAYVFLDQFIFTHYQSAHLAFKRQFFGPMLRQHTFGGHASPNWLIYTRYQRHFETVDWSLLCATFEDYLREGYAWLSSSTSTDLSQFWVRVKSEIEKEFEAVNVEHLKAGHVLEFIETQARISREGQVQGAPYSTQEGFNR